MEDQDNELIDTRQKLMNWERQELRKLGLDEPMLNANDLQKVIAIGKQNWWQDWFDMIRHLRN